MSDIAAIEYHLQILYFLCAAALFFSLASLTLIFIQHKKSSRRKTGDDSESKEKRKFLPVTLLKILSDAETNVKLQWNSYANRKRYLFLALLFLALAILLKFEPVLSLGAMSASIFFFWNSSKNAKWSYAAGGGVALLAIMLFLLKGIFPDWRTFIGSMFDIPNGLRSKRYANTTWSGPETKNGSILKLTLTKKSEWLSGDDFSLLFEGFIYFEDTGAYDFYLTSDDGAFIRINGDPFLENPGFHASQEVAGRYSATRGLHPIEIRYFNGTSDADFKLEWMPPSKPREIIPTENLFQTTPRSSQLNRYMLILSMIGDRSAFALLILSILLFAHSSSTKPVATLAKKRQLRRFVNLLDSLGIGGANTTWSLLAAGAMIALFIVYHDLPRFAPLQHGFLGRLYSSSELIHQKAAFDGRNARFNSLTHRDFKRSVFGAIFEGWFHIQKSQTCRFSIQADNGCRLFIDSAMEINAWDADPRRLYQKPIRLTEGFHHIKIEYYNENLPAYLDLKWSPDDGRTFDSIPLQSLYATAPTQIQFEKDRLFWMIRNLLLYCLISACLLLLGWLLTSARFSNSGSHRATIIPLAISMFVCFFLLRSSDFDPDYQYGCFWFGSSHPIFKTISILFILIAATPFARKLLSNAVTSVERHKSIQNSTFLISVFCAIMGQKYFTGPGSPDPKLGVILFGVAGLLAFTNRSLILDRLVDESTSYRKFSVAIVFFIVVGCAAFMRFYRISEMPPGLWWDEAQTGIVAREILKGRLPDIYDLRLNAGTIASYGLAGWFSLFGSAIVSMRSYEAALGLTTVIVSFFFFRRFFSIYWSLFGMACIAISRWHFSINRNTMSTIDETILITFLVFIFYSKAIKNCRIRDYAITGILLGLGLHLHTGARVLPVIIAFDMIVQILIKRTSYLKTNWKGAASMILTAWITFAPMFIFIIKHQDEYFKRAKETLLSTEFPGWNPVPLIAANMVNYLQMYSYSGDWHPRHNVNCTPQLAALISVIAVLGLCASIGRPNRENFLFLLGFFLISIQGILTVHSNTANLNRVAENIPIVHYWAVLGAVFLANGLRKILPARIAGVAVFIVLIMIAGVSACQEYYLYFHDHLKSPTLVGIFGFQPELTEPARYVADLLEKNPSIHVWAPYTRTNSFEYILPAQPRLHDLSESAAPSENMRLPGAIVALFQDEPMMQKLTEKYPHARTVTIPYSLIPNYPLFKVFFINETTSEKQEFVD